MSTAQTNFPANGLTREKLQFVLQFAALAPAENKWQSWKARLNDTHVELMVNDTPALEAIDPDGRESMIGCGAALLYLKLALKHFGCLGRVALFPDLNQPGLAARVYLGGCGDRDAREEHLFKAMTQGRASRLAQPSTPFCEKMLATLNEAVAGERGWLDFVQSEASRQRVLEITLASEPRNVSFGDSSLRQTNVVAEQKRFSWPRTLFSFGSRSAVLRNLKIGPLRSDPAMTLAVIKTKTDDKHGWLAAGQTMARAILQAKALGLAWTFFNRVRHPGAREALRTRIGHKGFAQVILRFDPLATDTAIRRAAQTTVSASAPR